MSSQNPQIYYEDEAQHGSYVYVSLEEMVINFIANYTGDGTILGKTSRSKILYQFKQGIKKFSINATRSAPVQRLQDISLCSAISTTGKTAIRSIKNPRQKILTGRVLWEVRPVRHATYDFYNPIM